MDITLLIYAVLALGVLGGLLGLMLDIAQKRLSVEEDQRVSSVRACLSGANCGACGFAGCDAFAAAVVNGKVLPNGCPVGGANAARSIAEIMHVQADPKPPAISRVICQGTCDAAKDRYEYKGYQRCSLAVSLGGGPKECFYACVGLGDCERACKFGAITMKDGIAHIDDQKCTNCGACAKACPRNVIHMHPVDAHVLVRCNNKDDARRSRAVCTRACIACGRCVKACKYDAIQVVDNLAIIDDQKCTACKACVEVCPCNCITVQ